MKVVFSGKLEGQSLDKNSIKGNKKFKINKKGSNKMSEINVVKELYKIIEERKENPIEGSYTSYLFEEGLDKILKKIGEESAEVIISSKNNDAKEIVSEISDLAYHILVLMVAQGVKVEDIVTELETRRKKICNKKQKRDDIVGIH
jgi:phosphoribosyl-ATP pyrophosphohydrolase